VENVKIVSCPNGLTLILDRMEGVKSAAYSLVFPNGLAGDPKDRVGASLILADLLSKGAGEFDSRALSDEFEQFGISHSEVAGKNSFAFRGICLSEFLPKALSLTAKMVLSPLLPEDQLDPIKSLIIQDIESIPDSPSRWCMLELYNRYLPDPYNRPSCGELEGVKAVTKNDIIAIKNATFCADGAVLSISGEFDENEIERLANELFGSLGGKAQEPPVFKSANQNASNYHVYADTAQTQLAFAFPSAKFGDEHFYAAALTQQVLSGGSFGRLYVEVRSLRGLCYSVSASHSWSKDYGATIVYAGTTPERVSETLATINQELKKISGDVSEEELARAKASLKSSLFLSLDSSFARASSYAGDWLTAGRVRSSEEIKSAIDNTTLEDIKAFTKAYPADKYTLVVLGRENLIS
jgi:predicted Zn-dependent peptidase